MNEKTFTFSDGGSVTISRTWGFGKVEDYRRWSASGRNPRGLLNGQGQGATPLEAYRDWRKSVDPRRREETPRIDGLDDIAAIFAEEDAKRGKADADHITPEVAKAAAEATVEMVTVTTYDWEDSRWYTETMPREAAISQGYIRPEDQ